ncbi:MAG: DUF1223 domain-containing protein [Pseudomonadota bacterium]
MPSFSVSPVTLKPVLLVLTLALTQVCHAIEFTSSSTRTGLLEVYTSEGCSSCPPADRWLSSLKAKKQLWRDLIPIAFHVDYWNYIGWSDRFSDAAFSARQQNYRTQGGLKSVYTPGFVYNGKEWRNWFRRQAEQFPNPNQTGILRLNVEDGHAQVSFEPLPGAANRFHVNLVLLGFDLATDVKAGENRGRNLQHDFVVLGVNRGQIDSTGEFKTSLPLPNPSAKAPRYAVAAWVSPTNLQTPLQAVGGYLPTGFTP